MRFQFTNVLKKLKGGMNLFFFFVFSRSYNYLVFSKMLFLLELFSASTSKKCIKKLYNQAFLLNLKICIHVGMYAFIKERERETKGTRERHTHPVHNTDFRHKALFLFEFF